MGAAVERGLRIRFAGDAQASAWGDAERWLGVYVSEPPDLDQPHHSHPARVTAWGTDSDAWAHRVFDALDATGRYSLFMVLDHEDLVRANSDLARAQWDAR
ncbi:hypothetical protein [Streptomyces sp. NPDC007369]|uniref:hypothetical protein n=1 Tax=Streptomyces sp. NPDC007369 TaxID=3154589 RepID=UPI0033D20A21